MVNKNVKTTIIDEIIEIAELVSISSIILLNLFLILVSMLITSFLLHKYILK